MGRHVGSRYFVSLLLSASVLRCDSAGEGGLTRATCLPCNVVPRPVAVACCLSVHFGCLCTCVVVWFESLQGVTRAVHHLCCVCWAVAMCVMCQTVRDATVTDKTVVTLRQTLQLSAALAAHDTNSNKQNDTSLPHQPHSSNQSPQPLLIIIVPGWSASLYCDFRGLCLALTDLLQHAH